MHKIPKFLKRCMDLKLQLEQRKKINEETGCWEWTGSLDSHGYGQYYYKGKLQLVHRLSASVYLNFDLTSKLFILHKNECHNRKCFNPKHLYSGTAADNFKDRVTAKNGISNLFLFKKRII